MEARMIFLLAILLQGIALSLMSPLPRGLFDHPQCYITVRELAGKNSTTGLTYHRQIELNWVHLESNNGWVGLFYYDPSAAGVFDHVSAALFRVDVTSQDGTIRTDIQLELGNTTNISSQTCYGYWIAYFQDGSSTPSVTNCYRLYPTWMNDLKDEIGDRPLHSIMIPGTHDAGAWKIYNPATDDIISKITYTQEEDISNQLVTGIRYLDIRVAYYPTTPELFWVNHDIIRIRPLTSVLDSVLSFVQKYKEIVIMDFHRFPVGFTSTAIHELLYEYVTSRVGTVLAPRSLYPNVTPNQLWDLRKYVLLTYSDDFNNQRELLWPGVTHAWGDTNQLSNLETYLGQAVSQYGCSSRLWSAMAELTPRATDVLTRNLRTMANEANKPASRWYQQPNWYSKSNIISTDFYEGNDVTEICVEVNRNKGVVC